MTSPGGNGSQDAWQLSAELKPKGPDAAPAGTSPPDVVPPGWADAAEGVRTTVKWMVTAFAVVGGVMFAKGFVTTPKLDWGENTGQLVWAWIVGTIGLAAIGWLILQAVDLLRPSLYELGDLPPGYVTLVNADPRFYLPSDCDDLDQFLANLSTLRRKTDEAARQHRIAEAALQDVTQADPDNHESIATAKQARDRARARHDSLVAGLSVYNAVRKDLLERAGYWQACQGLNLTTWTMVVAAVLAAAGGIGYQLLLATPEAAPADDAGPAAVRVGELVQSDTAAGRRLWEQLRLASCQASPTSARVAVVVASGKGTESEPYVVSTIPTEQCFAATFSVFNEVARVNLPAETAITYTPAASPTPQLGQ